MTKNRIKSSVIAIVVVLFFILSTTNAYAEAQTIEGIKSIKSNNSITVVMDDNYPPFSFRDSKGELQGIAIDQWKLFQS